MSTTSEPKSTVKTKTFVMGHSSPTGDKKTRNAPLKVGTHGGKGQESGKRGSDFLSRDRGRSRRSKRFDTYAFTHKHLRNPVTMAKELAKLIGAEKAFGLASELAAKGVSPEVEFMTKNEMKKNEGHWRTIAGYLKKRLEIPMAKW